MDSQDYLLSKGVEYLECFWCGGELVDGICVTHSYLYSPPVVPTMRRKMEKQDRDKEKCIRCESILRVEPRSNYDSLWYCENPNCDRYGLMTMLFLSERTQKDKPEWK